MTLEGTHTLTGKVAAVTYDHLLTIPRLWRIDFEWAEGMVPLDWQTRVVVALYEKAGGGVGDGFFGTRMLVAALKHNGTTARSTEELKMSVETSLNSSAQSFSTRPGMPSGSTAMRMLIMG